MMDARPGLDAIYSYADSRCWLAQFSDTPCSGRLQACHLVPKRLLRREVWQSRRWRDKRPETFHDLVWDERCWRPGCELHHHQLDESRKLRIPRAALPVEVEEFAGEWGLGWWLDREYPRAEAA